MDTLRSLDGRPHAYEALFHLDAPVHPDAAGCRLFTGNAGAANLAIAARPDAGLGLRIVEGQENPVQGWLTKGIAAVRPAPVAVFQAKGDGETHLLYVLAPAPAGAPDPVVAVEPVEGNPLAARIRLRDGRALHVVFSGAGPADLKIGDLAGKCRALVAETKADGTPGRRFAAAGE